MRVSRVVTTRVSHYARPASFGVVRGVITRSTPNPNLRVTVITQRNKKGTFRLLNARTIFIGRFSGVFRRHNALFCCVMLMYKKTKNKYKFFY